MVQLASPLLFHWLGGTGFEPKSNRKNVLVFRSMLGHQTASLPSQMQGKISRRSSRLPVVPMAKDRVLLEVSWWVAHAMVVCPLQNSVTGNGRATPSHLGILSMISRRMAWTSFGSRRARTARSGWQVLRNLDVGHHAAARTSPRFLVP